MVCALLVWSSYCCQQSAFYDGPFSCHLLLALKVHPQSLSCQALGLAGDQFQQLHVLEAVVYPPEQLLP